MEKRRKRQVLDGTGSGSLSSACRRLSCIGRLSVDLRKQQHSAALWETKQLSLGTALASRGQRASLPSGKKNGRKRKITSLKVACWNVRTMQDSEFRPKRRSAHSWQGNYFGWTSILLLPAKYALPTKAPSRRKMELAIPSSSLERTRKSTALLMSAS